MKTNKILVCALLLTVVTAATARADVSLWENMGVYGADVKTVKVNPVDPDKIWATSTWAEGLFKSVDGGETWVAVSDFTGGHANGIAIAPAHPDTIYVGFGANVYKSTDGGDTWTAHEVEANFEISVVTVDPNNEDIVYAGTGLEDASTTDDANVYKSTDDGVTWERRSGLATQDTKITSIAVRPGNSDLVLVGTGSPPWNIAGDIWRTTDGGTTWDYDATIHNAETWIADNGIIFDPTAPDHVYAAGLAGIFQSTDGGESWTRVYENKIPAIGINDGGLFACEENGLLYADLTVDPLAFTDLQAAFPATSGANQSIAFDPEDADVFYIGTGTDVIKTSDGGANFTEKNNGLAGVQIWSAAKYNDNIFAGTCVGFYKSSDNGITWTLLNNTYRVLDFWVSDNDMILAHWGTEDGIFKSTDGGTSWSTSVIPDLEGVHAFTTLAKSGDTVYAGTGNLDGDRGYVIKSSDAGTTFSEAVTFEHSVNKVVIHPTDANIIYAGLGRIPTGTETQGGIYMSSDGGQNFALLGLSDYTIIDLVIDETNPDIMFAGANDADGHGAVLKSTDGGTIWSRIAGDLPDNPLTALAMVETIYVAFDDKNIYYSTDSGTSWSHLTEAPYQVNDFVLGSLYVGTSGGLYRYTETPPSPSGSSGGCSIGNPGNPTALPLIAILVAVPIISLWLRRRQYSAFHPPYVLSKVFSSF